MYRGSKIDYYVSICGLLHDIGKPLLRYRFRVDSRLETPDKKILDLIGDSNDHISISDRLIRELGLDPSRCGLFQEIIKLSDYLVAAERGFGKYVWLAKEWGKIERCIKDKTQIDYVHHLVPLLSPLWVIAKTNYIDSIGPCSGKPYSADRALIDLYESLKPLKQALEDKGVGDICVEASSLLRTLKDEPLWFPAVVLTKGNIEELYSFSYSDATGKTNYLEISRWIMEGLRLIKEVYDNKFSRGYVDTLNELLKYTLLTVPAAVYNVFLPDTSLYSHSKLVSAYSSIISSTNDLKTRFRLLVLDARRIQEFVASPVVAKAASRVLRGRSFLAELISMSLVNYILELYGGLPYTNVLTLEGGSLTILVPALSSGEEEDIKRDLNGVVKDTFNRLKGLWFTIAFSGDFGLADLDYVAGLNSCRPEGDRLVCKRFFEVLESLERNLAIEKSVDEARSVMYIPEDKIRGFDAITREPVTEDEIVNGYGLDLSSSCVDYGSLISGGKLESTDLVGEATHLSLVAGSCLRNMIFLVSIYVYDQRDELIYPAKEKVKELIGTIRNILKEYGEGELETGCNRLYFSDIKVKDYGFNIGIIPLETLGAIHVMISSVAPQFVDVEKIAIVVVTILLDKLLNVLARYVGNGTSKVRVEVRPTNSGVEFINLLEISQLESTLKKYIERDIDTHVGVLYTGTYHPYTVKVIGEKQYGPATLVDLDTYSTIGLVKADADNLGEVRKLLSFSPTRLSSLSDLLSMIVIGKTHLLALRYSERYGETTVRGPIILYAGGDDVTFYGYWVDTLLFLKELYENVSRSLYPLSFTSSLVIEQSDYPLLELYGKAVNYLSKGKSEARGAVFINEISSPRVVVCHDGGVRVTNGLKPYDSPIYSKGFGSTLDTEVFSKLAGLLDNLDREVPGSIQQYRRLLMRISRISSLTDVELRSGALVGAVGVDLETLYSLTRRTLALSYLSARREGEFKELANLLGSLGINVVLHHEEGENVFHALRRLVNSKTFIDTILLYLHPYSTIIRH